MTRDDWRRSLDGAVAERAAALVRRFEAIARERMAGLPFLHPDLAVEVIGLAPQGAGPVGADDTPAVLTGVLLTPWFMNLMRLPMGRLDPRAARADGWLEVGCSGSRCVGERTIELIGGCESVIGVYEAASLFSPMGAFADQAAARATARAVLRQLRGESDPVAAPARAPVPPRTPSSIPPRPARRGFLLGRPLVGAVR